ncbi:MAG: PorP/SprF family type IX secretion system membrane protein, partial [Cytophagales bacterium]
MKNICLAFLLTFGVCHAQDPHFSQFFFNKLYLNPAYAGADNGMRFHSNFREQWPSLPSRIRTFSAGYDAGIPMWGAGAGFLASHHVEGQGFLAQTRMTALFSKVVGIKDTDNEKLFLYFGLSAGMIRQSVDWDRLTFGDQLDPVLGVVRPTSNVPPATSKIQPDFGSGVMIRYKWMNYFNSIGFAIDHINMPDVSLYETGQRMPVKYTIHYQGSFQLMKANDDLYTFVHPAAIFQNQGAFRNLNFGGYLAHGQFFGGLWYRSQRFNFSEKRLDATIINIGFKDRMATDWFYTVGYSYDATLSPLRSRTGGTHEIAL